MNNLIQPAPSSPVVETASATTSPDNSNSGHTVYLVAIGVVLALTLLLAVAITSIQSTVSNFDLSEYSGMSEGYQNREGYGRELNGEARQRAWIGYR